MNTKKVRDDSVYTESSADRKTCSDRGATLWPGSARADDSKRAPDDPRAGLQPSRYTPGSPRANQQGMDRPATRVTREGHPQKAPQKMAHVFSGVC